MLEGIRTISKSIVIIGGGVIGLCTAYYALQKGHRVTILERGALDHDACSLGNAGMIVPSHFVPLAAPGMVSYGLRVMFQPQSPFYIRPRLDLDLMRWGLSFCRTANKRHVDRSAPLLRDLNLASRACYESLSDLSQNEFGLIKKGLLMLCKSEQTLHEEAEQAERAHQLGLPAEVLTPKQAAERDPGLKMDIAGAVYFPQDCHMEPQRFIAGLTQYLLDNGACFHWSTEVTGWRTNGQRIEATLTNQGEFTGDEYVLAGGAWSPTVLRDLRLALPMQAGKGYSVTLPNPKQLPTLCSILTEARVAVTPMGNSLRVGGTMEIAGLDNNKINPRRVQGILNSIPRYFPEFSAEDFAELPVWSGLRPCSPDGLPYMGRFAQYPNLSAATGHAMMGMSLGPITGKLMSEILSDEPTSIAIEALDPNRYQ